MSLSCQSMGPSLTYLRCTVIDSRTESGKLVEEKEEGKKHVSSYHSKERKDTQRALKGDVETKGLGEVEGRERGEEGGRVRGDAARQEKPAPSSDLSCKEEKETLEKGTDEKGWDLWGCGYSNGRRVGSFVMDVCIVPQVCGKGTSLQ